MTFKLTAENLSVISKGLVEKDTHNVIAARLGCKPSYLRTVLRRIGLEDGKPRTARHRVPNNRGALVLDKDHPAVRDGHTLFENGDIRDPALSDTPVLIDGANNPKMGRIVKTGQFSGYRIFHLSLEERATCPRACEQWASCYGNRMHRAARHRHGPALERQIQHDVERLTKENPQGVMVRLHTLGDFYSASYVYLWARLLHEHPNLAVFGYSRRHPGDGIGDALKLLKDAYWPRFAIRFSNLAGPRNAFVLKGHTDSPYVGDAIVCKQEWAAQAGGVDITCGECALCWEQDSPIVFVEH